MSKKQWPTLASRRSPNWAFMERFEIPDYDHPERNYLTRWRIIQTPWFGWYLHRMDGPDSRSTLHDHPWNFLSIILKGGYTEVVPDTHGGFLWEVRHTHRRTIGILNAKFARDLHYIEFLHRTPTWTMVFTGRRTRVWGYLDEDGWTAFDTHRHAAEFDRALAEREKIRGLGR